MLKTLFARRQKPIREMIGGYRSLPMPALTAPLAPTRDTGRADYAFWDRARRGQAQGLEVAGLFLRPLGAKIAGWVLGQPPTWAADDPITAQALNAWWAAQHSQILRAYQESLDLGDCFVVVNADLSLGVLPPHIVTPITADEPPFDHLGWQVTEVHQHPARAAERITIRDSYTLTERRRLIEARGREEYEEVYPNLIGRVPVIHIPNLPGADERYGRPEGAALVPLLHQYGAIFSAAVEGNIRQGRPTPVITFADDTSMERFWASYGQSETRTLPDGSTERLATLAFDADKLLTLSGANSFDWKSPGSFAQDTEKLLAVMFYLMLQHTEIPEFVWGNAIASSRASAEAQMPAFTRFIQMRRGRAEGWLRELAAVAVGMLALSEPGLQPGARLRLAWPDFDVMG